MSLALHGQIGPVFQMCGEKIQRRVVDISKVTATVAIDICRIHMGMHAYTECDTVSTFAG